MRHLFLRVIPAGLMFSFAFAAVMQAQSDPAKIFSTNCVLCHSANGSGDSTAGKALHAKDLRSDEVQKQNNEALAEVITKGKGKMPAFGTKINSDAIAKLVAYIRELPKK